MIRAIKINSTLSEEKEIEMAYLGAFWIKLAATVFYNVGFQNCKFFLGYSDIFLRAPVEGGQPGKNQ